MPRYAISVLPAVVVGGLTSASSAFALPHSSANGLSHRPVCAAVPAPFARCDSQLVTSSTGRPFDGKPQATSGPAGYHPSDLQSAYSLSSSPGGSGQTVAIVDAYNDPNAAKDLASYRSAFGLPAVSTCSVSTGKVVSPVGPCFVKVNQSGGTGSFPRNNAGWSQEISLDVDMVSAICPKCNIALVEASSNSMTNLGTAVNEAATLDANEISNSYGGSEFSSESSYDSYFTHPGFAITAGSGDGGYGVEYPAASPDVTGGRDDADREQLHGLVPDRLVGRRQRLLGLRTAALVAGTRQHDHRGVREAGGRRRVGRRGPEYRRLGLRHLLLPGHKRMAGFRRDQRCVADRRERLCAPRECVVN